jgi:hypothetical protein
VSRRLISLRISGIWSSGWGAVRPLGLPPHSGRAAPAFTGAAVCGEYALAVRAGGIGYR